MRRILPIALFLMSGCATAPQKFSNEKMAGQWEAKLQITDRKLNKTYNLGLDVVAERPDLLRAEVSATLGIAVASVLLKGKQISYDVHRSKRFYSGLSSDRALEPVLQVSFDPAFLFNLFFDEPIHDANWSCSVTPDRVVESCVREPDKLFVQWLERNGENKRIVVKAKDFDIQVLIKDYQTKVQNRERAFVLDPPSTYSSFKLN